METVFLSLTKSDFQDLIAETVNSCLKRNANLTTLPQPESEKLLTVQEAAKFLSLSVPTIYGLINKGQLPSIKRSKRVYFSNVELMDYMKSGRKKNTSEIIKETDNFLSSKKIGGSRL